MPPLKYWAFWDIHEKSVFLGQTPYTLKITFFRVAQMQKWMAPVERARNTGQENGMICYLFIYLLICPAKSYKITIYSSYHPNNIKKKNTQKIHIK